jgi:HlyD family secretion protein
VASSVTPSPRGATGPVRNSGAPATPSRGAARDTDHTRRRWPWITLAAVSVALLLWFVARPMYLGPVIIPSTVVRADFVQTVVASGHIETPFRVSIGSQVTGIVTRIPVAEGSAVRMGDTLLVFDAAEAKAIALQARGQLAQADARTRQIRDLALPSAVAAVAQAKATLLNVQQTFNRNLTAAGFDTPAARDEAQRNLDVARAQLRSAELQVTSNTRGGSDYAVAATERAQAVANVAATQSRIGYRVVTAPRAGVLISRDVEVGDVVQPGKALMQLSPMGTTQIVVQIDERNLGLISLGQQALASADAFPAQTFAADVTYINPSVDLARASVEVKLRVPTSPAYLRQDMTVSVDIETARHPDAVIASAADIHDMSGTSPWVLVVQGKTAARRSVRVGLVSGGRAEIISGLTAADRLVPATNAKITAGSRIRIREAAPAVATP